MSGRLDALTSQQISALERGYTANEHLTKERAADIGNLLNVDRRVVQIWFVRRSVKRNDAKVDGDSISTKNGEEVAQKMEKMSIEPDEAKKATDAIKADEDWIDMGSAKATEISTELQDREPTSEADATNCQLM